MREARLKREAEQAVLKAEREKEKAAKAAERKLWFVCTWGASNQNSRTILRREG